MEIIHVAALKLVGKYVECMTGEVKNEYKIFFENHIDFIRDFYPEGHEDRTDIHNILLAYENGTAIGFKYYFHSMDKKECELFYIYVDSTYRKKGVATFLVNQSISNSLRSNSSKFVVRMAGPNEERGGLVNKYVKIAKELFNKCSFVIYYDGKKIVC